MARTPRYLSLSAAGVQVSIDDANIDGGCVPRSNTFHGSTVGLMVELLWKVEGKVDWAKVTEHENMARVGKAGSTGTQNLKSCS